MAVDADVVEVSSEFSSAFAAVNALDGDPATEWSSAGEGDDATVDLGQDVDVIAVGFHTHTMADGSATMAIQL